VSEGGPPLDMRSEGGTAAALRRAFDESFAAPPTSSNERLEGLLAIRLGLDPFALRLSEVVGIIAEPRIVPVPSPMPLLLGIIGRRGVMAPVYDLAAALNYPPAVNVRWMVMVGKTQSVGLGFETFEAHVQVPCSDMQGTVRAAGALRPVINVMSLLQRFRSYNP
jgi:chemotaxis signal transduction protein